MRRVSPPRCREASRRTGGARPRESATEFEEFLRRIELLPEAPRGLHHQPAEGELRRGGEKPPVARQRFYGVMSRRRRPAVVEVEGLAVVRSRCEAAPPSSATSVRRARQPTPMTAVVMMKGTLPFIVEAAGIEPASKVLRKERRRATSVTKARFSAESVAPSSPPGVPSSPLESPPVLETCWRRRILSIGRRSSRREIGSRGGWACWPPTSVRMIG
jgi:hypothetical protein